MAPICGIDADTLRYVARLYATSKASMILWGMGISQHVHGTDNARCLIALALMTGQIGRPGTGLHPLRGQNNVQGASDAGLIPMMFPDYQRVDNRRCSAKFEKAWGVAGLDDQARPDRGRDHARHQARRNPRHVHHGREPGHVRPRRQPCARVAGRARPPGGAGHLPDRDRLPGRRDPAGQRLPRKGRQLHQHRPAGADGPQAIDPPGEAKQDLWIIQQIANRMGLDWHYNHVSEVFDEMRHTMPSIGGITWERLEREHAVTYPCMKEGDPGQPVVFTDHFPRESAGAQVRPGRHHPGRRAARRRVPDGADHRAPARALAHRQHDAPRAVLDAIEPDPVALVHPLDLAPWAASLAT
jgi:formate dehydrogenase major subunit